MDANTKKRIRDLLASQVPLDSATLSCRVISLSKWLAIALDELDESDKLVNVKTN